jgi:hypothetical protein
MRRSKRETSRPRPHAKKHARPPADIPGTIDADSIAKIVTRMLDRRSMFLFQKPFDQCGPTQQRFAVLAFNLSVPTDCRLELKEPECPKEE